MNSISSFGFLQLGTFCLPILLSFSMSTFSHFSLFFPFCFLSISNWHLLPHLRTSSALSLYDTKNFSMMVRLLSGMVWETASGSGLIRVLDTGWNEVVKQAYGAWQSPRRYPRTMRYRKISVLGPGERSSWFKGDRDRESMAKEAGRDWCSIVLPKIDRFDHMSRRFSMHNWMPVGHIKVESYAQNVLETFASKKYAQVYTMSLPGTIEMQLYFHRLMKMKDFMPKRLGVLCAITIVLSVLYAFQFVMM